MDAQEIQHIHALIAQYKRNLRAFELQRAQYFHTPLDIINGIDMFQAEIQRLEQKLRDNENSSSIARSSNAAVSKDSEQDSILQLIDLSGKAAQENLPGVLIDLNILPLLSSTEIINNATNVIGRINDILAKQEHEFSSSMEEVLERGKDDETEPIRGVLALQAFTSASHSRSLRLLRHWLIRQSSLKSEIEALQAFRDVFKQAIATGSTKAIEHE